MTKEQHSSNYSSEFSNRTDSNCVWHITGLFKDFWPNELDSFKQIVGKNPFIDLACGNSSCCNMAIAGLTRVMGRIPIHSYIGVDRFNIDENSKANLITEMGTYKFGIIEEESVNICSASELQPNLFQNITLIGSDMLEYLKNMPPQSIRILSIGGFADCICDSENPYRKQVIQEIQRVLSPDSYFLCAWSLLDITCDHISEVDKNYNFHFCESPYSKGFRLYKSNS